MYFVTELARRASEQLTLFLSKSVFDEVIAGLLGLLV